MNKYNIHFITKDGVRGKFLGVEGTDHEEAIIASERQLVANGEGFDLVLAVLDGGKDAT